MNRSCSCGLLALVMVVICLGLSVPKASAQRTIQETQPLSVGQPATPAGEKQVPEAPADEAQAEWVPLFNGNDLTGWTPKIRGYELGDNFGDTFRVVDGLLQVRYDGYDEFNSRFGHLFYETPYSNYDLRIEYRVVGDQCKGGAGWALRNSGVMIHGQDPSTMARDQDFPVSIEVQLLGGDGTNPRHTANLCTPGTHVEMDGKLVTRHCNESTSKTYHGDQWVTVMIEVRGNDVIRHMIDGEVVLEYNRPQLDPNDKSAKPLIKNDEVQLSGGTISLQSESHPFDFRKVEIRVIEPGGATDSPTANPQKPRENQWR